MQGRTGQTSRLSVKDGNLQFQDHVNYCSQPDLQWIDQLYVDLTLTITNALEELINTSQVRNVLNNTKMFANLSNTTGVYFVEIRLSSGERFVRKVIFER